MSDQAEFESKAESLLLLALQSAPVPVDYNQVRDAVGDDFAAPTPELFKHFLEVGEIELAYDVFLGYGIKIKADKKFWDLVLQAGEYLNIFKDFEKVKKLMESAEPNQERKISFLCRAFNIHDFTSEVLWNTLKGVQAYFPVVDLSKELKLTDDDLKYIKPYSLLGCPPFNSINPQIELPFVFKNSPEEFKRYLLGGQREIAVDILSGLGKDRNAGPEFWAVLKKVTGAFEGTDKQG